MLMLVSAEKGEGDNELPRIPLPLEGDSDYAIETWLQHRVNKTYPRAGGYDDQDALLMEDWKKLTLWYVRVSRGAVVYDPAEPVEIFPDVRTTMHD